MHAASAQKNSRNKLIDVKGMMDSVSNQEKWAVVREAAIVLGSIGQQLTLYCERWRREERESERSSRAASRT